jgi:hypothetical protein
MVRQATIFLSTILSPILRKYLRKRDSYNSRHSIKYWSIYGPRVGAAVVQIYGETFICGGCTGFQDLDTVEYVNPTNGSAPVLEEQSFSGEIPSSRYLVTHKLTI